MDLDIPLIQALDTLDLDIPPIQALDTQDLATLDLGIHTIVALDPI